MIIRSKLITIFVAFILLGIILNLVRKKKLKEQYALLWIGMATVGITLAAWRGLVFWLSNLVGIHDPANYFFLVTLLFLMGILIHFSVAISVAMDRTRVLAQELAIVQGERDLLEKRLSDLEQKLSEES